MPRVRSQPANGTFAPYDMRLPTSMRSSQAPHPMLIEFYAVPILPRLPVQAATEFELVREPKN